MNDVTRKEKSGERDRSTGVLVNLNKNRKNTILGVGAVILIFILFLCWILPTSTTPEVYDEDFEDQYLYEDEHDTYRLYTNNNDWVKFYLTITLGAEVDIYILNSEEIGAYADGKDFQASYSKENISSQDGEYHVEKEGSYFLVVDNSDNGRKTDSVPKSDVKYDLEYSVNNPHWWESTNMVYAMMWLVGLVFVICFLVMYGIATRGEESHYPERAKIYSRRKKPPPQYQNDQDRKAKEVEQQEQLNDADNEGPPSTAGKDQEK